MWGLVGREKPFSNKDESRAFSVGHVFVSELTPMIKERMPASCYPLHCWSVGLYRTVWLPRLPSFLLAIPLPALLSCLAVSLQGSSPLEEELIQQQFDLDYHTRRSCAVLPAMRAEKHSVPSQLQEADLCLKPDHERRLRRAQVTAGKQAHNLRKLSYVKALRALEVWLSGALAF